MKWNRLLALGADSAENAQAVTDWASQNQPDFSVIVPFAPDYASADEINKDGITAGNQTNAAKYNGHLARRPDDMAGRLDLSLAAGRRLRDL